jgi:hypothetical protein
MKDSALAAARETIASYEALLNDADALERRVKILRLRAEIAKPLDAETTRKLMVEILELSKISPVGPGAEATMPRN